MKNNFSFTNDEMNGPVETAYKNIVDECKSLIKLTNCPNEQVVALLSVIASNFAPITEEKRD